MGEDSSQATNGQTTNGPGKRSGVRGLTPAVAGTFYPADPRILSQSVRSYIESAPDLSLHPKAIIAPHAGYDFSGPIAGSIYRLLDGASYSRVVIMGPAHRVPFSGIALPASTSMHTPMGEVAIDEAGIAQLAGLPDIFRNDQPFLPEHSLEVQLPFLQSTLGAFRIIPLLTGKTDPLLVGEVLGRLWGGSETLILVSSDLSHYLDYARCQEIDAATTKAISLLRGDFITNTHACGHICVNALIQRARARGMRVTPIDTRNSGDTQGGKDRVVGYGAFCFEEAANARFSDTMRTTLLRSAGQAITARARTGQIPKVDIARFPVPLRAPRGAFVTVTQNTSLRGCIGSVEPHQPLIEDIVTNACKAGFADPRFSPLTEEEARNVSVSISVLGPLRSISANSENELLAQLQPDRDGLLIRSSDRGAIFLPHVWRSLPNPVQFLRHLKAKAGIPAENWGGDMRAWRYQTEEFSAPMADLLDG